jgi:pyruvate,water dikinase
MIKKLNGVAVSSGLYEGQVKIVLDIKDFNKVEEGDVLVVYASSPAWTVPLLKAGALIAEVGGILCHTAIIAREIGVPAIVNVESITKILTDGQRVLVNGESGELYVFE